MSLLASLFLAAVALLAGKKAGHRRPAAIIRLGFLGLTAGLVILVPIVPRASTGWALAVPLVIAGLNPAQGTYNFADVNLVGDTSALVAKARTDAIKDALAQGRRAVMK